MASSWTNKVEHVRDGEPVEARVDSRPTRALENQSRYLKDRIDGIENRESLVIFEAAVEPDAILGMAVRWNGDLARFERALAEFKFNRENGVLETSPLSEVIGVVGYKHSSTIADVIIFGRYTLDIEAVIDDESGVTPGRYFLSGKTKGKLSKKPAIADVAVLHADGSGSVYIQPQLRDGPSNHVHYEFELSLEPCGDSPAPAPGGTYSIINVDDGIRGWLPASHSSFNGLAPTGAAFGYNIKEHQALYNVFPPMPAESSSITLFKNETDGNGVELPLGTTGLVYIDINGIWWMSDCYGDVPWSNYLGSSSMSQASTPECPRDTSRKLLLRFAKSSYSMERTVVTSLDAVVGSGLSIIGCYDNKAANTGPLKIDLDLGLAISSNTTLGSLVFKEVDSNKFKRGRIVEGLVAADNSVSISSTHSRLLDPLDEGSDTVHQGIITISTNLESVERFLQPQVVRLSDAKERYYQDVMYLAFPPSQVSSIRLKILVPHADTLSASPEVKLRLRIIGRTSGTLPSLSASYRILPNPVGSGVVALPTTDSALPISTSHAISSNEYISVDSDTVAVDGQDIVFFTISRASGDGYAGEVGIIEAVAVLT
jgi:hypothetical protein